MHPPRRKDVLDIIINKLRMNISGKQMHRSTKDDIPFLVGLDLKEMDSKTVGLLDPCLDSVYPDLDGHVKTQGMTPPMAQDGDSEEALYCCYLYELYRYDKYVLFDFEIVSNSLDVGKYSQI